jgi:hypothetical protein
MPRRPQCRLAIVDGHQKKLLGLLKLKLKGASAQRQAHKAAAATAELSLEVRLHWRANARRFPVVPAEISHRSRQVRS